MIASMCVVSTLLEILDSPSGRWLREMLSLTFQPFLRFWAILHEYAMSLAPHALFQPFLRFWPDKLYTEEEVRKVLFQPFLRFWIFPPLRHRQ